MINLRAFSRYSAKAPKTLADLQLREKLRIPNCYLHLPVIHKKIKQSELNSMRAWVWCGTKEWSSCKGMRTGKVPGLDRIAYWWMVKREEMIL